MVSTVFRAQWQYSGCCIHGWGWFHFTFDTSIWKGSLRMPRVCQTQRGRNWALVVALSGGVIAHDVTLGAYMTNSYNSFRARSFLALLDKGSSSWMMSHFTTLMNITNFWRCWTYLFLSGIVYSISKFCRINTWTHQTLMMMLEQSKQTWCKVGGINWSFCGPRHLEQIGEFYISYRSL